MTQPIQFLLNDHEVSTPLPSGMLVLDYLRTAAKLMGTKEGCKEGDCGACVILIGELLGKDVSYKPVTSCLMPLGELNGKHAVTIEGLNGDDLTLVQQAIVDEGATQCGFCTPGIVVSMTGLLLDETKSVDADGVKYALSGHLCRCTGYRSLKNSVKILSGLNGGLKADRLKSLIASKLIPPYFSGIAQRLTALRRTLPEDGGNHEAIWVAGGTDLYVQIGETLTDAPVTVLDRRPDLKGIHVNGDDFRIGAMTTFEAFADHPDIQRIIPDIKDHMQLNASWQIRNRATLGGNIINASPIGDMTCLLLAMDARLVLVSGKAERIVAMDAFFLDYKRLNKQDSELLREISFAWPGNETRVHFEKVSKRKHLDIASVNSAIRIQVKDGVIRDSRIAVGGVAPIPLLLTQTNSFLAGQPVSRDTIQQAAEIMQKEIAPIGDIRGSAAYKRLLARQLFYAHFTTLFPQEISYRELHEAY